jgi:hypothetical protein
MHSRQRVIRTIIGNWQLLVSPIISTTNKNSKQHTANNQRKTCSKHIKPSPWVCISAVKKSSSRQSDDHHHPQKFPQVVFTVLIVRSAWTMTTCSAAGDATSESAVSQKRSTQCVKFVAMLP